MFPTDVEPVTALEESLYAEIGGLDVLRRVHKIFYDKIYRHPWLKQFFTSLPQELIEAQQTDFMAQAMGGPSRYSGKLVAAAHTHIFITDELFETRSQMLADSLVEAGVPEALGARWLKIDRAFKSRLVKQNVSECIGRYRTEPIMNIPKPPA